MGQYKHHGFVCTSGKTCPPQAAGRVHAELRRAVEDAGMRGGLRVNHAGSLSQWGRGPMVVAYPHDVWCAHVDERGATRIVAERLVRGRIVDGYRYHAPPGDNQDV